MGKRLFPKGCTGSVELCLSVDMSEKSFHLLHSAE